MSADLTQAEADALFALEKHRSDTDQWNYPGLGSKITIPLISTDRHESFLLDLRRSRFVLARGTYQTRCRQIVILARLDFGGTPHRNPDGEKVGSTHLHLYRQGFGDKWAFSIPENYFSNLQDLWQMLEDFMRFCNIVEPPDIWKGSVT